ncbi:MAG TPA: glycosyl transferase family 2 [Candidatus Omnitrophica bacterium]|nr:MAG: hypothetical protein A2Z81_06720 [Omnitrophica WOR_2 bacterium GWA2_45_18]HBR15088.1 glycosyl transferase family 2 [Candidatus Omnitrophota bacterium]
MPPSAQQPKVSVKMVTYNHESFIAQAIESVLMQEVEFDYEIVIGEDSSTDGTRGIVLDYQKRYPDRVRLLLTDRNRGRRHNFLQTLKACRGKYVAMLDGDDYWTSPRKLQKQADFLDTHPGCAICFHNAVMIYENGKAPRLYHREKLKQILKLEDLLYGNIMPTCATMFRNHLFDEFPGLFDPLPFGDWPLQILNARHGDIGYLDEVMSVYRIHSGGLWSRGGEVSLEERIQQAKGIVAFYKAINQFLAYQYDRIIRGEILKQKKQIRRRQVEKIKRRIMTAFPRGYHLYRWLKDDAQA